MLNGKRYPVKTRFLQTIFLELETQFLLFHWHSWFTFHPLATKNEEHAVMLSYTLYNGICTI